MEDPTLFSRVLVLVVQVFFVFIVVFVVCVVIWMGLAPVRSCV